MTHAEALAPRVNSHRTWGLDMSTSPGKTAAVALEWSAEGARVVDVRQPLDAFRIIELVLESGDEPWAVDVPFGWPDEFVSLMADRATGALAAESVPADADWGCGELNESPSAAPTRS